MEAILGSWAGSGTGRDPLGRGGDRMSRDSWMGLALLEEEPVDN